MIDGRPHHLILADLNFAQNVIKTLEEQIRKCEHEIIALRRRNELLAAYIVADEMEFARKGNKLRKTYL